MSQTARLRRISFTGNPVYLGEHQGNQLYSANPDKVANWLCDGYRTRFNQHRSLRKRSVYDHGQKVLDAHGNPLLEPIGNNPVDITDKQARQQFSFLAAMPTLVLQAPEKIETTEWFAATKRRKTSGGALPRFRSRKKGDRRFSCWYNGGRNAVLHRTGKKSAMLVITGQNPKDVSRKGRWAIRFHIRFSQPIRAYTSVQIDLTRKQVTFINPGPAADRSRAQGVVGLDRGVARSAATSDGQFFNVPETPVVDKLVVKHQRTLAKKRRAAKRNNTDFRASKRYAQARTLHAQAQRRRAATKNDALHAFTRNFAENYETIIAEALIVKNMTGKRKGKGASAKRSLNRGITDARWAAMLKQLSYKTAEEDRENVITVPAAYTSQRCSECGYIAAENRKSQAVFVCQACGHTANADTNAAKNIVAKHIEGWANPSRGAELRRDRPSGRSRTRVEA